MEFNYRTDPFLADTDGDGLSDDEEIFGYTVYVDNGYDYEYTWSKYDSATGEEFFHSASIYIEKADDIISRIDYLTKKAASLGLSGTVQRITQRQPETVIW